MLKVGLTGGLASGKSFAAREFERLGCSVLQADKLGHRILVDDPGAIREVVEEFGPGVLNAEGGIDRKALGARVFADGARLGRLNAIVHPRVFERLDRFFAEVEAAGAEDSVAMVEAAIMVESGSYRKYQRLVLAACPREMQVSRFVAREGASREEAESRIARQLPLSEKRKLADYVIDTSGSKEHTLRQVRAVYGKLKAEAALSRGKGFDGEK